VGDQVLGNPYRSLDRADVHRLAPAVVKMFGEMQQAGYAGAGTDELGCPVPYICKLTDDTSQPWLNLGFECAQMLSRLET
jgi:hypothetical protein